MEVSETIGGQVFTDHALKINFEHYKRLHGHVTYSLVFTHLCKFTHDNLKFEFLLLRNVLGSHYSQTSPMSLIN